MLNPRFHLSVSSARLSHSSKLCTASSSASRPPSSTTCSAASALPPTPCGLSRTRSSPHVAVRAMRREPMCPCRRSCSSRSRRSSGGLRCCEWSSEPSEPLATQACGENCISGGATWSSVSASTSRDILCRHRRCPRHPHLLHLQLLCRRHLLLLLL